ncbi:hypothetical protein [Demequina zhanjiangensis]|uniref:Uncharacterized protein n=1 Tax=Demequina zhanjiangensis TaxID=3051659 RepID=A0ABT8G2V5_9MICO|nr:hypothetical protein [Demequina sp. SYSU T00b26]MDN4473466.1 hypothetical protein [Demequina sp. SYSU T00b26]
MSNPLLDIERARRTATGTGFSFDRVPSLDPTCDSQHEFNDLVSSYYVFFREHLGPDVRFLRGVSDTQAIREFDGLINGLRTAAQHAADERARRTAQRFLDAHAGWPDRAQALAGRLNEALASLARIAVTAMRSHELSKQWTANAALNLSTIFDAVSADLGLSFRAGQKGYMIRQLEGRVKFERLSGEISEIAKDYCMQEIVSTHDPLPVPYYEVLDALRLIGSPYAQAAVLIAYSVAAAAPQLHGDEFLERVQAAWIATTA